MRDWNRWRKRRPFDLSFISNENGDIMEVRPMLLPFWELKLKGDVHLTRHRAGKQLEKLKIGCAWLVSPRRGSET